MYIVTLGNYTVAALGSPGEMLTDAATAVLHGNTYANAVLNFESIRNCDALIVCIKGFIDEPIIAKIMYAMLQKKPIILYDTPVFSANTTLFRREVILQRLSKFMIGDLSVLDKSDLLSYIPSLISNETNYVLTKHEITLMRASLRAHFRDLLATQILKQ